MTKSAKHKKARKADFAKTKLKLGKGKQAAANDTNTSYKSQSIVVPTQSLTERQSVIEPKTRRGLTLVDVLQQCDHPNERTRRDALTEVGALVQANPELLEANVLNVVQALSHHLGDPLRSARHASSKSLSTVLGMMRPSLRKSMVERMMPFLVYAMTSALDDAARKDGVNTLAVLVSVSPESFRVDSSQAWYAEARKPVIEALLDLLRLGSATYSNKSTFTKAKTSGVSSDLLISSLQVIGTMFSAYARNWPEFWYMAEGFSSSRAFLNFCAQMGHSTEEHEKGYDYTSIPTLSLVGHWAQSEESAQGKALTAIMGPTLIGSVIESCISISNEDQGYDLLRACLECTVALLFSSMEYDDEIARVRGLDDENKKMLAQIMKSIGPHFPFPDFASNVHVLHLSALGLLTQEDMPSVYAEVYRWVQEKLEEPVDIVGGTGMSAGQFAGMESSLWLHLLNDAHQDLEKSLMKRAMDVSPNDERLCIFLLRWGMYQRVSKGRVPDHWAQFIARCARSKSANVSEMLRRVSIFDATARDVLESSKPVAPQL